MLSQSWSQKKLWQPLRDKRACFWYLSGKYRFVNHQPHHSSHTSIQTLSKPVVETEDSVWWVLSSTAGAAAATTTAAWMSHWLLSSSWCYVFNFSLEPAKLMWDKSSPSQRCSPHVSQKCPRPRWGVFMVLQSTKIRDNARWRRQNDLRQALLFGFIAH